MSKIGDGGPSLADIVRLSGIDETQIVYAFVYGSRLFGTATAESGLSQLNVTNNRQIGISMSLLKGL